jgi:hypothetical protein
MSRQNFLILCCAGFLFFSETTDAIVATQMRRAKSQVPTSTGLAWSPLTGYNDFLYATEQTFTLTNFGPGAANGLFFSVPIRDPFVFVSHGPGFAITATTCGSSLAAGASCTVVIAWENCNTACTSIIPVITTGSVTATSGADNAVLSPLTYNSG